MLANNVVEVVADFAHFYTQNYRQMLGNKKSEWIKRS
jgi:hypothetical protein